MGIISLSLFSVVPLFHTSSAFSPPVEISHAHTSCNGVSTCALTGFSIFLGDFLTVSVSVSGEPNSCAANCGVTPNTFGDSLGNTFIQTGYQGNAQNPNDQIFTVFYLANITHAGSDIITQTLTIDSGSVGLEYGSLSAYDIAGTVSFSTVHKNGGVLNSTACCAVANTAYGNQSFLIEAVSDDCVGACNSATDLTYTNPPLFVKESTFVVGSTEFLGSARVQRANSINSPNTFPVVNNGGGTDRYWTETVLVLSASGGGGGGGCSIYVCTTITYSVTWGNQTCVGGNSGVCTMTTTWTTIHYDSTFTNETIIHCGTMPNCAGFTQGENQTETYTDTSVSLVIVTTTTTTTATAVIAPTTNSLLYWFFGFVSLLIPPATLVGIRANQGGTTSGEDFIPLILIGLFVGSLLGLILNVLPWEFLIAFGGILVLYVIRSRL